MSAKRSSSCGGSAEINTGSFKLARGAADWTEREFFDAEIGFFAVDLTTVFLILDEDSVFLLFPFTTVRILVRMRAPIEGVERRTADAVRFFGVAIFFFEITFFFGATFF